MRKKKREGSSFLQLPAYHLCFFLSVTQLQPLLWQQSARARWGCADLLLCKLRILKGGLGNCSPSSPRGSMSSACSSYYSADGLFVDGFSCPRLGNAAAAVYCCGFNDVKYCCDDPNSFFPYEYGYMWWLRWGKSHFFHIQKLYTVIFLKFDVICSAKFWHRLKSFYFNYLMNSSAIDSSRKDPN